MGYLHFRKSPFSQTWGFAVLCSPTTEASARARRPERSGRTSISPEKMCWNKKQTVASPKTDQQLVKLEPKIVISHKNKIYWQTNSYHPYSIDTDLTGRSFSMGSSIEIANHDVVLDIMFSNIAVTIDQTLPQASDLDLMAASLERSSFTLHTRWVHACPCWAFQGSCGIVCVKNEHPLNGMVNTQINKWDFRCIGGTYHKAYFSGLNFREYPHNIWPYIYIWYSTSNKSDPEMTIVSSWTQPTRRLQLRWNLRGYHGR